MVEIVEPPLFFFFAIFGLTSLPTARDGRSLRRAGNRIRQANQVAEAFWVLFKK